jgi:endogenous inhibitor of DNA gyrase (YacG/DUF329 family)
MSDQTTDVLCPHCNKTFAAFLHELAEKNAKVVCPNCGKEHDDNGKAAKSSVTSKRAQP